MDPVTGPSWRSLVDVTVSTGRAYAAEKTPRPRWWRIGPDEPVPTEPHILVERSLGVQVSDRNVQVNTYDLRVTPLQTDLAAVLDHRDVQRALTDLAKDPTDPDLRENADRVLGTRGFFATQPTLVVERGEITDSATIFGFLFVRRQENHFVYVSDATVDARELLARSPTLREAVIDSIRSPHEGPELRESLDKAVAHAVGIVGTVATKQRREDRLERLERKQAAREARAEIARERKLYGGPAQAPQQGPRADAVATSVHDRDDAVDEPEFGLSR